LDHDAENSGESTQKVETYWSDELTQMFMDLFDDNDDITEVYLPQASEYNEILSLQYPPKKPGIFSESNLIEYIDRMDRKNKYLQIWQTGTIESKTT
jgi:predicted RNA-binding Zn ribbon-like protein